MTQGHGCRKQLKDMCVCVFELLMIGACRDKEREGAERVTRQLELDLAAP